MHEKIKSVCETVAHANHGQCKVNILKGYPVLVNDEHVTARTRELATAFAGSQNVIDMPIRMGSEDFAYYTHHVPACFYRLGVGNTARGITAGIHTPTFNIDEGALQGSIGLMAWIALNA